MTTAVRLRRFLVLQALLWWQGGFVFYAAVVVPIGTDELGSELAQGLITRRVTHWLNLLGVIFHGIWLWDIVAESGLRHKRLGVWTLSGLGVLALMILQGQLSLLLIDGTLSSAQRGTFRGLHLAYLWISTLHWLLGLLSAWWTLHVWSGDTKSSPWMSWARS